LRCDWRRRQEQCSDQREFLHLRSRSSVWSITDQAMRTGRYQSVRIPTLAYEDRRRALNLLNRVAQ
jgi:hypothetical protein